MAGNRFLAISLAGILRLIQNKFKTHENWLMAFKEVESYLKELRSATELHTAVALIDNVREVAKQGMSADEEGFLSFS